MNAKRVALLLVFALSGVASGVATDSEWPTADGSFERTSGVTPSDAVHRAWSVELGEHRLGGESGSVSDGIIIIPAPGGSQLATGGQVQARRLSDGALVWHLNESFDRAPAIADGAVFFSSDLGVTARRLDDGALLWDAPLSNASEVVVAGGRVISCVGGAVVALTQTTGTMLWSADVNTTCISSLTIQGDSLIFSSSTETFRMDSRDGRLIWRTATSGGVGAPVVTGALILVHTRDGVSAFDIEDGHQRWAVSLELRPGGHMAFHDGSLYVQRASGLSEEVIAIRIDAQSVAWHFRTRAGTSFTPVVANDLVYVVDGRGVFALDGTTGRVRGHLDRGGDVTFGAPLVVGEYVIVRSFRIVADREPLVTTIDVLSAHRVSIDDGPDDGLSLWHWIGLSATALAGAAFVPMFLRRWHRRKLD